MEREEMLQVLEDQRSVFMELIDEAAKEGNEEQAHVWLSHLTGAEQLAEALGLMEGNLKGRLDICGNICKTIIAQRNGGHNADK